MPVVLAARVSVGVWTSPPNVSGTPNPTSSISTIRTFGAPGLSRSGSSATSSWILAASDRPRSPRASAGTATRSRRTSPRPVPCLVRAAGPTRRGSRRQRQLGRSRGWFASRLCPQGHWRSDRLGDGFEQRSSGKTASAESDWLPCSPPRRTDGSSRAVMKIRLWPVTKAGGGKR